MQPFHRFALLPALAAITAIAVAEPPIVSKPDAFETLVNPQCSHCRDESARRADLTASDRVLCWIRGYSDGGAIPLRFFLAAHRVISDSYGVFVYDPEAGYSRGFAPSYEFRFHGWRNGVMVMRHSDGTLYSCLSGLAFDGPKKGTRLAPAATLMTDWGFWLRNYPQAVAYHMFDKYKAVDLPPGDDPDSVRSRSEPDARRHFADRVLGVWSGTTAKAYPIADLARAGAIVDSVDGRPLLALWEPTTKTAAAYRPIASQPRKFKAPAPDKNGVSKPDEGVPVPPETAIIPPRKLTIGPGKNAGRFVDAETKSVWDVAGRCVEGELKGWTLEWVDGVDVKWFAWAAEYPRTAIYKVRE